MYIVDTLSRAPRAEIDSDDKELTDEIDAYVNQIMDHFQCSSREKLIEIENCEDCCHFSEG